MTTYEVDRDGFPIKPCRRCSGTGVINGYRHVLNGVCFGCSGNRYAPLTKAVAELAAQYRTAVRNATRCTMATWVTFNADGTRTHRNGVEAGDRIKFGKDDPWRTVAAIRPTRRVIGYGIVGVDPTSRYSSMTLETHITFDDGETVTGWGIEWRRLANQAALRELRDQLAAEAVASLPKKYRR